MHALPLLSAKIPEMFSFFNARKFDIPLQFRKKLRAVGMQDFFSLLTIEEHTLCSVPCDKMLSPSQIMPSVSRSRATPSLASTEIQVSPQRRMEMDSQAKLGRRRRACSGFSRGALFPALPLSLLDSPHAAQPAGSLSVQPMQA